MQLGRNVISNRGYLLRSLSGLFVFLIVWASLTHFSIVSPFFLPSPIKTTDSIARLFAESDFLSDILISIYRIAIGFALSVVVAVPLGILVGTNKSIEAFIGPLVAFVRYIPTSAFVPLSILWLGVGEMEKFFIIFIGIAPYLLVLVADTVANVKNEFVEAGYTLGATTKQIYTDIIIPHSLPGIWDGMRLMFGVAWTFIILTEIIAATSGLGYVLIRSQRFLQTANVVAVIIVIGALGIATDYLFKAGHDKFFPWSEKA